jgi:hypothetical protein
MRINIRTMDVSAVGTTIHGCDQKGGDHARQGGIAAEKAVPILGPALHL